MIFHTDAGLGFWDLRFGNFGIQVRGWGLELWLGFAAQVGKIWGLWLWFKGVGVRVQGLRCRAPLTNIKPIAYPGKKGFEVWRSGYHGSGYEVMVIMWSIIHILPYCTVLYRST